jgi:hypothetical protein
MYNVTTDASTSTATHNNESLSSRTPCLNRDKILLAIIHKETECIKNKVKCVPQTPQEHQMTLR